MCGALQDPDSHGCIPPEHKGKVKNTSTGGQPLQKAGRGSSGLQNGGDG